jgi:hypothetical protein
MISRSTGEVVFRDGLLFRPQALLTAEQVRGAQEHHRLAVPGWFKHDFGAHESDHGSFAVAGVSDPQFRLRMLLLQHLHPFYQTDTPEDEERRAFHEGVISADLGGQREFRWGQVLCRLDEQVNKDWLVLTYDLGAEVPRPDAEFLSRLHQEAPIGG